MSRAHLPGDFSLSRSASPAASLPAEDYLDHKDSDSIMGEVQDRISQLEARLTLDVESVMPRMPTNTSARSGNKSGVMLDDGRSVVHWMSTVDSNSHPGGDDLKYSPKPCIRVPFRPAVILTLALGALLACSLMFLPLLEFSSQLTTQTTQSYLSSLDRQFSLVEELTSSAALTAHSNILDRISSTLWDTVLEPPERALDAILGSLSMLRSFQPDWSGTAEEQRAMIAYRSVVELQGQHAFQKSTSHRTGIAEFIYVGFEGEEFAGASIMCTSTNCTVMDTAWYDCPYATATPYQDRFARLGAEHRELGCETVGFPTQRPWYVLQSSQKNQGTQSLQRMWSGLYVFLDNTLGFTRTAPIAPCGNYSCLQGVVAADISLPVVSRECSEAFNMLQQQLNYSAYSFPINSSNAAVFVVFHTSRGGQGTGLLIGSSAGEGQALTLAEDSPQAIVRSASRALLHRFGAWEATALQEQQRFRFRLANESKECGSGFQAFTDPGCIEVGTLSVQLDEGDRWLVVLVSPAAAFHALAQSVESAALEEFEVMDESLKMMGVTILQSAAFAFLVTTVITVGIGFGLGTAVASPLKELSGQLRRLGNLDFNSRKPEVARASRIRDVSEVQDAFCRLSRGIETFARFVPEPVVRNIIKGDCRASRLHVARREVTILFSDIRDFTTMSESMEQIDLIFLLTRYLSIMSRIVETFGGVVAEILGDGLLVYWNTPLPVEDHAVKACAAAVAMQQALGPLNCEMLECGLPNLFVRIGINTGHVLSGTFGSDKKMKFGCMGDPVNLASRLEGLCKAYGVGTVCSGTTYDCLAESGGFICRMLDLVQVKGRKEAVLVYEVMGCDDAEEGDLEFSECAGSEGSQPPSPWRQRKGTASEVSVSKTYSLDSNNSRKSQASRTSKVSEVAYTKSPSQAALDALEDSRQCLTNDPRFNWKQVLEQKQHRMACKRNIQSMQTTSSKSNPVSPAGPRVSFALPPPVVATPDVDRMHDLARRYEMALEAYQGARFDEAKDLAEVLLTDYPEDVATKRLSKLAQEQKAASFRREEAPCGLVSPSEAAAKTAQGCWSPASVMFDKE